MIFINFEENSLVIEVTAYQYNNNLAYNRFGDKLTIPSFKMKTLAIINYFIALD